MYMKILKRISENIEKKHHCVKSTHSRSYSGPHFPAFGLNTEKQAVSLRIQSECRKIRTRITPNTDTFHVETKIIHQAQVECFVKRFVPKNDKLSQI